MENDKDLNNKQGQETMVTIQFDLPTCFKISIALDQVMDKLLEGTPGIYSLETLNSYMKEMVLLALKNPGLVKCSSNQIIKIIDSDDDPDQPF
jgi:hypothetical protein